MPIHKSYFTQDSHEFVGEASNQSERAGDDPDADESMETETATTDDGTNTTEESIKETTRMDESGDPSEEKTRGEEGEGENTTAEKKEGEEEEYNPLIVRRSRRAIKPTKDVDLYLLGAKFGIDVEGSDADSSDQEFAPVAESDRELTSSNQLLLHPIVLSYVGPATLQ